MANELVRTEDGKIVLSDEVAKKVVDSHIAIVEAIPDIDKNLVKIAKGDDAFAAISAARILFDRVGLSKKDAKPNAPGLPELDGIPTETIRKEWERRQKAMKTVDVVEVTAAPAPAPKRGRPPKTAQSSAAS